MNGVVVMCIKQALTQHAGHHALQDNTAIHRIRVDEANDCLAGVWHRGVFVFPKQGDLFCTWMQCNHSLQRGQYVSNGFYLEFQCVYLLQESQYMLYTVTRDGTENAYCRLASPPPNPHNFSEQWHGKGGGTVARCRNQTWLIKSFGPQRPALLFPLANETGEEEETRRGNKPILAGSKRQYLQKRLVGNVAKSGLPNNLGLFDACRKNCDRKCHETTPIHHSTFGTALSVVSKIENFIRVDTTSPKVRENYEFGARFRHPIGTLSYSYMFRPPR